MGKSENFIQKIKESYTFKGETITMGGAIYEGECINNLKIKIPLKTLNRHGLIAGATGTGKTKTLQVLAEGLSEKSIPVLLREI